jgi:hypothetical protein
MWMLLFLLFLQTSPKLCQASPPETGTPSLVIQVVDPAWSPVPGAEVTLKPLVENAHSKSNRVLADEDGYARFSIPGDADYAIEVKYDGDKNGRLRRVHLFKTSSAFPTAYVQVQLRVSGPKITFY